MEYQESSVTTKALILLLFFSFWSSMALIFIAAHFKNRKEFPELQLIIVVLPGKTPVYAEVTFLYKFGVHYLYFVIVSPSSHAGTLYQGCTYVGIGVEGPDPHL